MTTLVRIRCGRCGDHTATIRGDSGHLRIRFTVTMGMAGTDFGAALLWKELGVGPRPPGGKLFRVRHETVLTDPRYETPYPSDPERYRLAELASGLPVALDLWRAEDLGVRCRRCDAPLATDDETLAHHLDRADATGRPQTWHAIPRGEATAVTM